jgi:hypothetical protein
VKLLQAVVIGVFVAIVAVIIFVRAGQRSGVSGGQQSSQIINASGDSFAKVVSSLEGG